ncbi:MAG: MFS transporter [Oscillospiraceae bacterium]|nr:MFS transporter [Oscillospiraceae bacterium]
MKKNNAKIGIYMVSVLMMGAIGISSALATIGAHFPQYDQTYIANLASAVTLAVIPTTLVTGKLMDFISKKALTLAGIVLFLIGGVVPFFLDNFNAILGCRIIFGVSIGLIQTLCAALVAENYEGADRDKVMGTMNSFQMLGCIIMQLIGGRLADMAWNYIFLVHLIAIVGLIGCVCFLPYHKPVRRVESSAAAAETKEKFHITGGCVFAWVMMLIYFIVGQVYSNSVSYVIMENGIGTAADTGIAITCFAIGGFVMGFFFSKVSAKARHITMAIGLLVGTASYILVAFSGNLIMLYIASFITGLGFSIMMPSLMNGAANSVNAATAGVAVAVSTCLQNVGQTVSPYITNPVGYYFAPKLGLTPNQGTMLIFGIVLLILGVILLAVGISKNAKEVKNAAAGA